MAAIALAILHFPTLPHPLPCCWLRNRYDETPVFLSISETVPAPAALAGATGIAAAATTAVPPQRRSIPGATPPGTDGGTAQRTTRTASGGLGAVSAMPEGVKESIVAATADRGGKRTSQAGSEDVGKIGAGTGNTAANVAAGDAPAAAGEGGGKLEKGRKESHTKA